MHRQRWLDFVQEERLDALWDQFPEPARNEAKKHYSRLMARMLIKRLEAKRAKEARDESSR